MPENIGIPAEIPPPEVPESLRTGVYSNLFSISMAENEAILDFGMLSPDPRRGIPDEKPAVRNLTVARVIISRAGVQKLLELLEGLLKQG